MVWVDLGTPLMADDGAWWLPEKRPSRLLWERAVRTVRARGPRETHGESQGEGKVGALQGEGGWAGEERHLRRRHQAQRLWGVTMWAHAR